LEIPGLPRPTKPFSIFPEGTRRTAHPERSVVLPTASAAEQAANAVADNQRPAGSWVDLGRAGCCSGPKQVALRFSPLGDPTLGGAARWPSPLHLSGAQTERPGDHISKHHLGESKGRGRFWKKICGEGGADNGKLSAVAHLI
jgi:hypothetical protein